MTRHKFLSFVRSNLLPGYSNNQYSKRSARIAVRERQGSGSRSHYRHARLVQGSGVSSIFPGVEDLPSPTRNVGSST
ncbi:hypothetical protein AB1N83_012689 [Pleurotus pulmonarius]